MNHPSDSSISEGHGNGNMIKISDLQAKDVICITDGRKLGHIYDLELDLHQGKVTSIIIPGDTKLFGLLSSGKEWVIPWHHIVKIGADVILVRLEQRSFDPTSSHSPYPPPYRRS
ncbi:YlmC/YmxH family sporulation protein [Mechercharimyces sp. CAU 1602]|uniref:YlmC/YmxH family sporulation protein n=1 Tax=Mechercharimyces sp. CAU 1602 TaxID=2973933 RepID=UPI00216193CF|nr:YlmC/YmxH family sporulation protein [Mechercharimyces sp. CAU 1602]MCS1350633.1 YlmC/YmxH family sporulation protein [Mechercharimyces sp. CAU 1602]